MNVAEAVVRTLATGGVDTWFANPGTTELAFVAALDAVAGVDPYLVLQEGVASGAADGYFRIAGRPAATLLHLGPGLANALANLHNARRAGSRVIGVVGDHTLAHAPYDPPLASDMPSIGGRMTRATTPHEAVDAAVAALGDDEPTTIVVPADLQEGPATHRTALRPETVEPSGDVGGAVEALASGPATLLLGGRALSEAGLAAAARLRAGTGCRLIAETFPAKIERGVAVPVVDRLPYFPRPALDMLDGSEHLLLVGARSPVAFFGYPGLPHSLVPDGCAVVDVCVPEGDAVAALEELAAKLGDRPAETPRTLPPAVSGPITPASLGGALARSVRPGSIVVDEANTAGLPFYEASHGSAPFTHLTLTGGSLGFGLPAAVGAAIAAPNRPVLAFEADGAGMYTLQALWTMARYDLDVTVLVASNRQYRILRYEAARAGLEGAAELTDIDGLDWVALARGHGVDATAVEDAAALERALSSDVRGPRLVEARMEV